MWRRPEKQEKPPWESPCSKSTNAHLRAWIALAKHYRLWPGRQGRVVLALILPALAVGLSSAGAIGLLTSLSLLAGALRATAVTMFWPEHSASVGPPAPAADRHQTQVYALLLASAASLALLLG